MLISRISRRISSGTFGRPPRRLDFQREYNRKPARDLAARTAHVEAARKALAMHRAANFTTYPAAGATANEGMVPKASKRRRKIITGAKIGRVSQSTRVAQAVRDAR
jgi:hypothetical protein